MVPTLKAALVRLATVGIIQPNIYFHEIKI